MFYLSVPLSKNHSACLLCPIAPATRGSRIRGGCKLLLNNEILAVNWNYDIFGNSLLQMTNKNDRVTVRGDFVTNSIMNHLAGLYKLMYKYYAIYMDFIF